MILSFLYRFWWFLGVNIKKYSNIKIWIRTYKEVLEQPRSLSDYVKQQNDFSHNNKKNRMIMHTRAQLIENDRTEKQLLIVKIIIHNII